MSTRHAYLIMAHHEPDILKTLLQLLDDPRNEIFLHIDKKSDVLRAADMQEVLHASKLHLIPSMRICWGGDSQIKCELQLLECAVKNGPYAYYHLLSGVDLPIKSQDAIHAFFSDAPDKIYLGCNFSPDSHLIQQRIAQYHPFQNLIGRGNTRPRAYLSILDGLLEKLQRMLRIDRTKRFGLSYAFGDNWFSIPHAFAEYVLQNKILIRKQFFLSKTADELFLQTLACSSDFRENLVPSCYRAIDWDRGNPYTYRSEDVPMLLNGDRLFARKFSSAVDAHAIEAIRQAILPAADN